MHGTKKLRALHRAKWKWLSKHPRAAVLDWPGWKARHKNKDIFEAYQNFSQSFACYVADKGEVQMNPERNWGHLCNNCPLICSICSDTCSLVFQLIVLRHAIREDAKEWKRLCLEMAEAWPKEGE